MKLNLAIFSGICAALLLAPVSLSFAQDDQCVDTSAVNLQSVVSDISARCCSQTKKRKQKRCLTAATRAVKKTRRSLGKSVVTQMVSRIKNLRKPLCGSTNIQGNCNNSNVATVSEAVSEISSSCCGKKFRNSRKSCLSRQRRFVRKARKYVGVAFYRSVRQETQALAKAPSCGAGGQKSNCDTTRSNTDSFGNWLHKPVSDSTHSIVNLLPSNDSASSCRYENKAGKVIRDAYMSGRTNGFRETWRPQGGGSCGSFPSNMIFSCQIRGKRVCYKIPDACNRYD